MDTIDIMTTFPKHWTVEMCKLMAELYRLNNIDTWDDIDPDRFPKDWDTDHFDGFLKGTVVRNIAKKLLDTENIFSILSFTNHHHVSHSEVAIILTNGRIFTIDCNSCNIVHSAHNCFEIHCLITKSHTPTQIFDGFGEFMDKKFLQDFINGIQGFIDENIYNKRQMPDEEDVQLYLLKTKNKFIDDKLARERDETIKQQAARIKELEKRSTIDETRVLLETNTKLARKLEIAEMRIVEYEKLASVSDAEITQQCIRICELTKLRELNKQHAIELEKIIIDERVSNKHAINMFKSNIVAQKHKIMQIVNIFDN